MSQKSLTTKCDGLRRLVKLTELNGSLLKVTSNHSD